MPELDIVRELLNLGLSPRAAQLINDTVAAQAGGVSVDNGVDAPATISTLVAPGATFNGDTATLLGLRLIGPFPIEFDTPNLVNGEGPFEVELTPIANRAVVVRAYAIVSSRFLPAGASGANDLTLNIGVGTGALGMLPAMSDAEFSVRDSSSFAFATGEAVGAPFPVARSSVVVVTDDDQFLCADVQNFGDPLVSGAADIYAIIATPAS